MPSEICGSPRRAFLEFNSGYKPDQLESVDPEFRFITRNASGGALLLLPVDALAFGASINDGNPGGAVIALGLSIPLSVPLSLLRVHLLSLSLSHTDFQGISPFV